MENKIELHKLGGIIPEGPLKLVPTLPDTERAEELKAALAAAASHWCVACDAARAAGFEVQASFGLNAFGKTDITQLRLFKTY